MTWFHEEEQDDVKSLGLSHSDESERERKREEAKTLKMVKVEKVEALMNVHQLELSQMKDNISFFRELQVYEEDFNRSSLYTRNRNRQRS
mmetsp:Transcript_3175/g.5299  ORF Transcript_3175/g.5299 Transcript_3175/m.5299 type:complete len:90 (+) Transcript_3175:36-305(+)